MVNDFRLTISVDDFLNIVNAGMRQMTFGDLIERSDKVTRVEYSRDTKRYTLVFTSGKKLKVVEKQVAA